MVTLPPDTIHYIPQQITPFIGRETEIADVVSHLADPDCRLLTVSGFGGIGKTRLATEATAQLSQNHKALYKQAFPDGIFFVDLAPLTSTDLITTTIMDRLGISVSGTTAPNDQLLRHLGQKKLLLILDNFEHIINGRWLVSEILAHTTTIKILVTSRIRLNLPEETVYEVFGMTVPTSNDIDNIQAYSALLLFQQIAQRVDWRFKLDDLQVPYVIQICRLVDGIPLAIVMAAAWVRVLSCQEVAEDLTRDFELLEATLDHIPDRHRSIRVVFEYSWNLLTDADRQVFQKMSVFRGGCSRDAAEQITGATPPLLLSLADKSLLQFDADGRYQIHELLRQLAEEKLSANPQTFKHTHDLHCAYYADFLYQRKTAFTFYDHNSPAVSEIKAELDNVRVMWDRAIAQQLFEVLARSADSLFHHHLIHDTYAEATTIFQKAVAMVETVDPSLQQDKLYTRLLGMLAYHAMYCGLYESSGHNARKALQLARTLDMQDVEARCLVTLGDIELEYGNYKEARQYLEQATTVYNEHDETYEAQFAGLSLGFAYKSLGEYALARRYYRQLISATRKRDTDGVAGWILNSLGHLENMVGNYVAGLKHCTEAVAIFERQGQLVGILAASKNLAKAYFELGQLQKARHNFYVGLKSYVEHGEHVNSMIINTLARIAKLFAYEGDITRAIELTSFVQHHPYINDETQTLVDTLSDELESELPAVIFQAAHARGKHLDLKELVAEFIKEFSGEPESLASMPEANTDDNIALLEQVTDTLKTGELFDKNLSEQEKESVHTLLHTVDTLLEKEKSKIMATFMESASHDLRTPLTIINTSLYLLERITDPEKQKIKLGSIKEQVQHLQNLIEDLIRMAQLDRGTEVELKPLDLLQLIVLIQQSYIPTLTANRNLDIRFIHSDKPLMVRADSDYLEQAVLNIIQNAIQYTPDDGSVTIEITIDSDNIVTVIEDTGIGIATDDLPHIFERFYRSDTARTERGRSGLGLAISQKIIHTHHGHIEVESALDEGSVFRIYLPRLD